MDLSEELIKQLEQGMYGYNPTVYDLMTKVSQSLTAVGVALALLFFWVDFEIQAKAFEEAGTTPDASSYGKLVMRYVLTIIVITNSGMILNFILWLAIQVTKWSHAAVGSANINTSFGSAKGIWGHIVAMFAGIASVVSQVVIKVLLTLRFVQMYLFKAIAPIILAFLAQKELRPNAIQFLKRFGGYALQGVVIILTVAIFSALQSAKLISLADTGTWLDKFKSMLEGIVQAVILVIAVIGTQKVAKDFLER